MRIHLPISFIFLFLVTANIVSAVSIRKELRLQQEREKAERQAHSTHQSDDETDATALHFDPVIPAWEGHRTRTPRARGIVINEPREEVYLPSYDNVETSDSDDQEDHTSPARTRIERGAKGKQAVPANTSYHDSDSSESGEDMSGLPDFEERLQLDFDPGSSSSSNRRRLPKGLTGHADQDAARAAFLQEWKRLGLGPHMTPTELADQVALMRVPGLKPTGKGKWSKDLAARYYGDETENYNDFQIRQGNISRYSYGFRKRTAKQSGYRNMPPDDLHHLSMQKAVTYFQKRPPSSSPRIENVPRGRQRQDDLEERIDEVGEFVAEHLKENFNKSLSDVTLGQLDDIMRTTTMPRVDPKIFTVRYFRWLHKRMGVTKANINNLRIDRLKWRAQLETQRQKGLREEVVSSD